MYGSLRVGIMEIVVRHSPPTLLEFLAQGVDFAYSRRFVMSITRHPLHNGVDAIMVRANWLMINIAM